MSLPASSCAQALRATRKIESVIVTDALDMHKLTRALDGRGFRGLGGPVEDAGITNDVVHAGKPSLRAAPCFAWGLDVVTWGIRGAGSRNQLVQDGTRCGYWVFFAEMGKSDSMGDKGRGFCRMRASDLRTPRQPCALSTTG